MHFQTKPSPSSSSPSKDTNHQSSSLSSSTTKLIMFVVLLVLVQKLKAQPTASLQEEYNYDLEPSHASSYPSQRKHWKEMMRNFMFDGRSDSERLKKTDETTGESNYYGDDDNNDDAGFDEDGRKKRAGSGKYRKDGKRVPGSRPKTKTCFFHAINCF